MAKLTYTLNEILFTDIKVPGHLSGGIVSKAKYTSGGATASTLKGGTIDGIFQTFNAVDIDWNGAELKNGSTVKATLNTTGKMLSILQTA